jgi:hypothetical protein
MEASGVAHRQVHRARARLSVVGSFSKMARATVLALPAVALWE